MKKMCFVLMLMFLFAVCGGIVLIGDLSVALAASPSTPDLAPAAARENKIDIKPLSGTVVLKYGTSPMASNAQMAGAAICSVVKLHNPLMDISEQVTGGGAENLRLLRTGEIDFGSVSDGIDAWYGRQAYDGEGPTENIRSVMTMYYSDYLLLTLADNKDVNTIYDLVGKRVAFGPAGSTNFTACKWIFDAYGLTDKIKIETMSYTDANDALIDGTVAAVCGFISAGVASDALKQLDNSKKLKVVRMDETVIVKATDDAYKPSQLIVGSLSCITEPLPCFRNCGQVIYARADVPDNVVYEFVRQIYGNLRELSVYHQICSAFSLSSAMSGFVNPIPVHFGAAAYYMEQGIWDNAYTYGN